MKHINPEDYTMFTIAFNGCRVNFFNFKSATDAWAKQGGQCLFLATKNDGTEEQLDSK